MVRLEWYRRLGLPSLTEESVRECFIRSLLESNRRVDFFVDWVKVRKNVSGQAGALDALGEIRGSSDPLKKLQSVLLVHPQALSALPMLLAWREDKWVILETDGAGEFLSSEFDFSGTRRLSETEAARIARFCEASGILRVLTETEDLHAYLLGVEAGMDTNARKNRSGTFMEDHVDPFVDRVGHAVASSRVFRQKKFGYLKAKGIEVPGGLVARQFDYAFISGDRRVSIEVNFYDKLGSKPQEIVDSYIERSEELRKSGWGFVWVTDGPGWKDDPPQIAKAFQRLDAVLNLAFCRRGILEDILSPPTPPNPTGAPSSATDPVRHSTATKGING